MNKSNYFNKLFKNHNGNIVIAQRPNPPLIIAISLLILSTITTGQIETLTHWGFILTLSYWAILEITSGTNLWRRLLGIVIALLIVQHVIAKYLSLIINS